MSPLLAVVFAATAASAAPPALTSPVLAQLRALAGADAASPAAPPSAPAPGSSPDRWGDYVRNLESSDGAIDAGRNSIDFLVDGKAVDAMTRELSLASRSIHIEVFQWGADSVGLALAGMLTGKAAAGVRVRVLVDQYGTDAGSPEAAKLLDFLRGGGIEVRVRPAPAFDGHLDHRKVIVVDGATGFVGGMNIGALSQSQWHDQMSVIRGPAVADLQKAFLAQWSAAGGAPAPDDGLFPAPSEPPDGCETLVLVHEGGGADARIKTAYLNAFAAARRLIRVADPYLVDADVVAGLEAAARRGVKVQVITPRLNDEKIVQGASRAYYPDLLAAGVEVYEYLPRMAHEKTAVVDDEWVTFGSSNLDARSLEDNDELNIVAFGAGLAAQVEDSLFEPDLKNSARIDRYSPSLAQRAERSFSWLLDADPAAPALNAARQ